MGLFCLAPLGLVYLGTILKNKGYNVVVYDENRHPVFNEETGEIKRDILDSDFVGISLISPSAKRGKKFLKSLKKQVPEIRTAVGGPHVLGKEQAKEFLEVADVVVQKEGEEIIEKIVEGEIKGIVEGPVVEDLDRLPIPDLGLIDSFYKKKWIEYLLGKTAPVSTARGCPRSCEFCAVSNMHGKIIRRRSPEKIIEELKIRYRQGIKRIFFTDDNFSIVPHERIQQLETMAKLKKEGMRFRGISVQDEVPALLKAGDSYIKLMKRAGITTVLLGIESFEDKILQNIHKTHHPEEAEQVVRKLRRNKIGVYGFCLANPDYDTPKSMERLFRKLESLKIIHAQITIETPIPGTEYWEKVKNRIKTFDWDKWDFSHSVIAPAKMKTKDLERVVKKNMEKFYSYRKALKQFFSGKFGEALITIWGHFVVKRPYS